MRVLKPIKAG